MDIVPKESSDSFKNCSFFLFIFLVFIVIITLGGVTLIFIFIVVNKPQKPKFSVETLRVESFDVIMSNCSSSNSILLVSSVVSLILNAQNPNKLIGIKYSPSRLHLCLEGIPVGVIRVPGFNQPAESNNVNVAARVLIHSLNVSQIVSGDQSKDDDEYRNNSNIVRIQLSGDVPLRLQLFRIITMIKIKVFLKCDINVDYRELTFMNEVHTIRSISQNYNASASVDHSNSTFNNCDIAIYI
ncbi:hypothetical protein Ddye_014401 [Dipteronia dyeriana]|uniref:Late embryogenesis abundant protein LEA-2 subgroup domain-containing protein n=1 Tax=Dipteronia dyeriana TaxID=168575 RepID=A0AAD9X877_9ROSI|nr:hypothetical protein Ddye_014401 [Dipteronia dyeriana]